MKKLTPADFGIIAALTVLAWLGTMLVRIPIPATTGYFNIGDIFVLIAGLWLGPIAGLIVGAIGPTMADLIGYPQFVLATFITKGCEGLFVGLIGGKTTSSAARKWIAAALGGLVMIAGYFLFEAVIYPKLGTKIPFFNVTTFADATIELLPNTLQAVIAVLVSIGIWKALAGIATNRSAPNQPDADADSSPPCK